MSFEYNNKEHWDFRDFRDFCIIKKPENPKLIKQIIYIDNKRLMILQSNSADILSDTLKKSAEIHVSPKINALFLITHQPFYKKRAFIHSNGFFEPIARNSHSTTCLIHVGFERMAVHRLSLAVYQS